MNIKYSSTKLEKILSDPRLIKKHYTKHWKNILNRHSELKNVDNLKKIPHIPPPRRHKLEGDLKDHWGVDYSRNHRFIIEPIGDFNINDLTTITDIRIINLEDYH